MDALSDVLRAVRLTGAVFFDVLASEPWVAETPPGGSIVGTIFPGAEHLISYHVVARGTCWGARRRRGAAPSRDGRRHRLSARRRARRCRAQPGMRDTPNLDRYRRPSDGQLPFTLTVGASGRTRRTSCAGSWDATRGRSTRCSRRCRHVIHVSDRGGGALGELVRFAVAESKQPRIGGECVLGRLSELMFVDVVRRYLETLPAERTGWLAGAARPVRRPRARRRCTAAPRTTGRWKSLAREVGLSRSALAERFTEFVGQPPMQYLANWRMQLAANHLMSGTDNVAEIAERVGYESEAAFSRAFKKAVGVPPGQWRKHRAGGVVGAAAVRPGSHPCFWRTTQIAAARRPCRFTRDN